MPSEPEALFCAQAPDTKTRAIHAARRYRKAFRRLAPVAVPSWCGRKEPEGVGLMGVNVSGNIRGPRSATGALGREYKVGLSDLSRAPGKNPHSSLPARHSRPPQSSIRMFGSMGGRRGRSFRPKKEWNLGRLRRPESTSSTARQRNFTRRGCVGWHTKMASQTCHGRHG